MPTGMESSLATVTTFATRSSIRPKFPLNLRRALRYSSPVHNAPTPRDVRRRWFGAFFLAIAAAMVIWGQMVLEPYLKGIWFLLYWSFCALITLMAIGTALTDVYILRRRARREQRDLFQKSFDLERETSEINRSNEKNSQR